VKRRVIRFVLAALFIFAVGAQAENLMPNGSFEACRNYRYITGSAGWGRFQMTDPRTVEDATKRTWYIDETLAWHGKKSVCTYQYLESQFVRVKAGETYTISLYVKGGAPGKGRVSFVSGARSAYVSDGPRIMKEIAFTTEWQRVSMTGKTEGKDPCAYVVVVEVYGRSNPVWVDAVQVEQGEAATAFSPARRIEVGTQFVDETPAIGIYTEDESPHLVTSVYVEGAKGGEAGLVHRIVDHRGKEVDRIQRRARIDEGGRALDEVELPFRLYGAFRVETDARVGKEEEGFAGEAIFCFVPRIPAALDDAKTSRFGSRFILAPFPREGGERFLPSWIGGEREILARVGAEPPYNYGVVTAKQAWKFGIRWVRWSPGWGYVETERGKFDWSYADNVLDTLEELGFQVQAQFASSPRWSHPDEPDGRVPPDDIEDWRRWLEAFAGRYKGRFGAVEIWNESFSNFLGTAQEYSEILKVAYETVKGIDPEMEILGISGCRPSYVFRMTKEILELVGTQYMDKMSYHHKVFGEMPDEMTHAWEEEIGKLHAAMAEHGGDRGMWNTEYQCWTEPFYRKLVRGAGGHSVNVPTMPVDDAASGLVRSCVISIANGVERFQYFGTYNSRGSSITSWSGHELLDYPLTDSVYEPDYSPRPLVAAHAALASQIAGATFREEVRFGEGQRGRAFLFDGGAGPLAVVWALRARTGDGTLDWGDAREALRVIDIMSNELEATAKMPLGAEPVYVRADSFEALRAAVSEAKLTGLPVVDKVSDFPLVETCLHSAGEKGSLELVVRVINVTPEAIKPAVSVGLAEKAVAIAPAKKKLGALARGGAVETRFRVTHRERPAAVRNKLSVSVESQAEPASVERDLEIAYALPATNVIVIDGDLGEWDGRGAIHLGERRDVAPGLSWDGPDDLSGDVMLRWDDKNLYVGARVTDDHLDRHPRDDRIWDGTCLELFFDVDLFHDSGIAEYNADDYHFLFAPATEADRGDVFMVSDNSGQTETEDIAMKSKRTARGYDMEVALPRRIFDYEPWLGGAGKKFKKGHSFGIGISLNDAAKDRTARKTILIWGGSGDNWRDISKLATVVMVER